MFLVSSISTVKMRLQTSLSTKQLSSSVGDMFGRSGTPKRCPGHKCDWASHASDRRKKLFAVIAANDSAAVAHLIKNGMDVSHRGHVGRMWPSCLLPPKLCAT
jgi:hypothetical protein